MAHTALIEKIRRTLEKGIDSEPEAMYLLAEIRKVMELEKSQDSYEALYVHCCWAVHAQLTKEIARRIVRPFDSQLKLAMAMSNAPNGTKLNVDWAVINEASERIQLTQFRNDFQRFISKHGLVPVIVDDDSRWFRFLGLYSLVIEETPLRCLDDSTEHIKHLFVRRMEIPEGMKIGDPSRTYLFALDWCWKEREQDEASVLTQWIFSYPNS